MSFRPTAAPHGATKGESEPGHAHGRAPGSITHERPFALPDRELITHVIHLPFPISVNAIWRVVRNRAHVHIHSSKDYLDWISNADALFYYLKQPRGPKIERPFEAQIMLSKIERKRSMDLDNYSTKAVLDRAQSWGLIANDNLCERLSAEWGSAPHGAKLVLVELA